jgi:lysozyme
MDAGLCWSTYHFLRPGDMAEQMQHYLGTINPRPGERVCLDHEDAGVSVSQLRQAVQICLGHPNNLQVTIYSGHLIEEQLGGERDDYLAENTSLWTAQYTNRPNEVEWNSATWPTPSLWQYTDEADVIGIEGPVDGNKWNGTGEALKKWFGPAEEEEPEEPLPPPTPGIAHVDIAIKTENAVVSITVNGETILAAALTV